MKEAQIEIRESERKEEEREVTGRRYPYTDRIRTLIRIRIDTALILGEGGQGVVCRRGGLPEPEGSRGGPRNEPSTGPATIYGAVYGSVYGLY